MTKPRRGPRDIAREVLSRLEQEDAWATPALSAALERSSLSPADRGLCTELVYGVVRNRERLDRALTAHMPKGLPKRDWIVANALRIAAYQLLMLDRVPAHAAVDDAVSAIKALRGDSMGGFANAVLRKLASGGEPPLPPPGLERIAIEHSLPRWILDSLAAALGHPDLAELDAAAAATVAPPTLSLRVTARTTRDAAQARLAAERPEATLEPSPLLPEAILARGLAQPQATKVSTEGWVVAQDVGAQLIARMLAPGPDARVLDACAGRGGKTLHLFDLGARDLTVVDLAQAKLAAMADLARSTGVTPRRMLACDLTDAAATRAALGEASFDAVLLDAPCSGLGVLRRHPEAKLRRAAGDPARMAELTARIIDNVAPLVAPGGVLVFAVCTFTPEETEAQLGRLLARHPFTLEPPPAQPGVDWVAVTDARDVMRTFPHRHQADAFFAARLRRRST